MDESYVVNMTIIQVDGLKLCAICAEMSNAFLGDEIAEGEVGVLQGGELLGQVDDGGI